MQCPCKNRGEIASLAYAAYHSIPFIGTCDQGCYIVQEDLPELKKIKIFGSEVLLYFGFDRAYINSETIKRIKALYKYLCAAQIKRGKLPATFKEYLDLLTRVNWLSIIAVHTKWHKKTRTVQAPIQLKRRFFLFIGVIFARYIWIVNNWFLVLDQIWKIEKYSRPKTLTELGVNFAPQSFMYLCQAIPEGFA
jgi:hypothetical protein